jgi:exonuclease SbcC
MRLHRLTMSAIGPFAGEVVLDFARLGDSGVFLLEGPTGSGKSTIIDALSFALYGKVAQSSATVERLRSHHAEASDESWVELIFETQSGIFRIRRTPSFERPKRDGSGTRKVNMTVKIWRLTSPDGPAASEPLSTRISEADDEVTRAVGLTHEQFVQTVVLPQGEFANFLRSKSEDKKALLQKLFGTEIVSATQDRLIETRRDAEQQRAGAQAAVHKAIQAFAGASGIDEATSGELETGVLNGDHDQLTAIVSDVLRDLSAASAHARILHEAATAERLAALATSLAAQDLRRRQARRAELRIRRQALLDEQSAVEARRSELDAAERAVAVNPVAQALVTALDRANAAKGEESTARSALPAKLKSVDETALRSSATHAQTLIGSLSEAERRERELSGLRADHTQLVLRIEQYDKAISAAARERSGLPEQISQQSAAYERAVAGAAREADLIAEYERAEERFTAAERADKAATLLAQEAQITREAAEAWDAQEARLATLRLSWRASVAGELGVSLVSGDPCVVCGSVEHPAPARRRRDHVSQNVLDAAEKESRRLRDAAHAARQELDRQQTALIALQLEADKLNPDQARKKLADVGAALREAQAAAGERDRLSGLIEQTRTLLDTLTAQISAAETDRAAIAERAAALGERISADCEAVDRARDGYRSVAERVAALHGEVSALTAAADAAALAESALRRAMECGEEFRRALSEAGFTDEQHWQRERRSATEISSLRRLITEFDTELSAVSARLAEDELTDAALDGPEPEIEPLEQAVADAESAEAERAAVAGSARDRLNAATKRAGSLQTAISASSDILSRTAAAIRLGNLAAGIGDNQLRMDLTTFVLIRRFADVVSAANSQLRRVSGGRYELEHSDAKSGNAKSGLGLRILDLHTGKPRDPATLSGGETFYVSLSLALGLADVVRAESGGVDLGTLFIDEGFGSLDPEVLDEVLAVLDSLREGGRAVGVVSHVAELKHRICERVEVRRNPDGSSRLTLVA